MMLGNLLRELGGQVAEEVGDIEAREQPESSGVFSRLGGRRKSKGKGKEMESV